MKEKKAILISITTALGVGILIGIFIARTPAGSNAEELRLGSASLTNPLLECEVGNSVGSRKEDFTPELREFVEELKSSNGVADMAVYFRDLNNGPVFGVEQDAVYAPASLLKVPVMMAYLRWSEDEPWILSEEFVYDGPVTIGVKQEFLPEESLVPGQAYTAEALIERMIRYSDNQALILLHNRLPQDYLADLYTVTGIDTSVITDPTKEISVRRYSIFFRILFNSSFLSRRNSEYALNLLTRTSFTHGIRESVPQGVTVAHKFGERGMPDGRHQLHDCGIVYYPNHPYMLCVMTRGENTEKLLQSIESVAAFVYQKIDEQYGE